MSDFPTDIAVLLHQISSCIKNAAPKATETISYNMPAFKYHNKIVVYFAAFKNHIGFYALPSSNESFKQELLNYKTGKGSIQFPLDKAIPFKLISKIVEYRMRQIDEELIH